ncbi:MAG: protein fixC [Peptococcaceae bacterium BICA1-8]|nr:MAG: protein fixC [Peptococcaceae bacterium BICA1-8]
MVQEKFDVIVVGAGPAGLGAAYTMANAGLKVIVFERGEHPGSKNVMGGVLYRQATEDVFPEFWKEAPLERPVIESNYWLTTDDAVTKYGYRSQEFAGEPYNSFTVFRSKFDRWMGRKVEQAGALLICETVVEDIIKKDGKVVGVKTGRPNGQVYADVVVIAEGVNSILTQEALGLQKGYLAWDYLAVAVKEVIALPKEKIEDRFGLEDGKGATIEIIGEATKGMVGTAFIYTNMESISIGVGALMSHLVNRKLNPNDLLENLKAHPAIKPLIAGGEIKEYLGHMIPEGGYKAMPKLYGNGVVIVGDAAQLVNGLHREGSNLALISGKTAGEVIIKAFEKGDFSINSLAEYQQRLTDSFVVKDLQKYQHSSGYFEEHPELFYLYPHLASIANKEFFTIDNIPKKEKQRIIMRKVFEQRPKWELAKDLYKLWRVLG